MKTRLASCVLVALVALPSLARAGGMFIPGRGARPLGRAGSFVAGADDAQAMAYNPAGLADIDGFSALLDAGIVLQRVHYDRVDSGNNPQPGVDGSIDILPIPMLAITYKPKKVSWLTLGGSLWAPYLGTDSYPENGPQRYQLISLSGSLLLVMELAAAFRINEHFWLGAGFENMIFKFKQRGVLSACTQLNCAPEDPSFDSLTQLSAVAPFTPSGIVGADIVYPEWRGGVSVQLPFWVQASGTVQSRLPTDPMFANTTISGSNVNVNFTLPLILRLGVEYRPLPLKGALRVEAGFDYESWSMQQDITVKPIGVAINDVPGIGTYNFHTMHVSRGMQDSFSAHIGGEFSPRQLRGRLTIRAGYLFETSATPDQTMSVLTPDGLHNMISLGLAVRAWKLRFDLGYAHLFTLDRTVTNSQWYQLNPIMPGLNVAVGNGHYSVDTDILALGVEGRF